MTWNKNCKYAPDKTTEKHCNKTNTGKRYANHTNRKESGIIGKGYYGCSKKCPYFTTKSGTPTRYVMNEALA